MSERRRRVYCVAMGTARLHPARPIAIDGVLHFQPGRIEYEDRHWMEIWEMSDGSWKQERVETPTPWTGPEGLLAEEVGLAGEPL